MNKKILIASLVTLASVAGVVGTVGNANKVDAENVTGGVTLYLKPNSNWTQANARFAMYLCNGSSAAKWYSMSDGDGDGIYQATVSANESHKNVIFVRMNPSNETNDWNNKWNQTGDLTWDGSNNLFTLNSGSWDSGTWSVYKTAAEQEQEALENAINELGDLVESYYNNGNYTRHTRINLNKDNAEVKQDLASMKIFHDEDASLERVTVFNGDSLTMTIPGDITYSSTYGTSKDGDVSYMTHLDSTGKEDYRIPNTSMEEYYTTLHDIKDLITLEYGWLKASEGVYKSENETLKQKFLDFTAPCFYNGNKTNENYISLSYVTIEFSARSMVMKLHVDGDEGKMITGSTILSSAVITKPVTNTTKTHAFPGDWNNWSTSKVECADGVSYQVMDLAAGEYEFKIFDTAWRGNGGTITDNTTSTSSSGWTFDQDSNCKFIASGGTYLIEAKGSNPPTVYIIKLA